MDESTARRGRRVEFFAVVVSIILLSIGIYKIIGNYRFSQHALHVQGTIIDFDTYEGSTTDESSTATTVFYTPVFEYEINGQAYRQKGESTTSPGYSKGEKVDVLVDPADPQKILVDTFRERWLNPVIFCLAAVISMVVAFLAKRFGW